MAAPVVLTRRPRTDDELDAVVRTLFGYQIPRHKVCADHDAPFDAFSTAYFRKDPQVLIRGSRGLAGKSRLLSVLGLTFAVVDGAECTILGGSLAQSKNVHDTIRSVIEYKGFNKGWLSAPPTNTLISFTNGAMLRPLTASQRTVRGPHPPVLIGDELDEMDPEIWESAKGQPMDQKNYKGELLQAITCAASTVQYADKCHAAGTMIDTPEGQKPIEEIQVGDLVLTRVGWKRVEATHDNGFRETVRVEFASGRTLRCTGHHEVWTNLGWVEASRLLPGTHVGVHLVGILGPVVPGVLVDALPTLPGEGSVDQGPVQGEVVTSLADPLLGQVGQCAGVVLGLRAGVEVAGVDAHLDPAQMIESEAFGDRADDQLVDVPVREVALASSARALPAVAVAVSPRPQWPENALVGFADDEAFALPPELDDVVSVGHSPTLLHTYDLQVEDVREYVANGILAHNTMALEMARFEEMGLPLFNWCHWESSNPIDGWLSLDMIERKRREVSAERWRVEYDLGEPSIGNRAFTSADVEAMFISLESPEGKEQWPQFNEPVHASEGGYVLTNSKEFQEYHFEDYRTDRDYVISADWAKEKDWTVITVTDATFHPARVVHWVRFHHLSWKIMVKKFNDLLMTYNCGFNAIHDATGVGNMVNDYVDERATGFIMSGEKRDNMLYDYIAAVEHSKIIAPRVKEFYRATLYASTEDMFSRGKEFHLPDEVCSMALGWHKIDGMAPAGINFEALKRDTSESPFEKAIQENKPPHRAQEFDNQKPGRRENEVQISFTG